MSNKNTGKATFTNLGSIKRAKELDKKGRPSYYFQVADGVEITINGKKLEGKFISVERPTDKFDRMLEKGKLSEQEYEDKTARFSKEGDLNYITFELVSKT